MSESNKRDLWFMYKDGFKILEKLNKRDREGVIDMEVKGNGHNETNWTTRF